MWGADIDAPVGLEPSPKNAQSQSLPLSYTGELVPPNSELTLKRGRESQNC